MQLVQFDETSHSITQGQSYEGVFTRGSYLDVRAGRHGSEEVAHDLHAGLTPDSALGLVTLNAPLPELNFAAFGNMSVTIDDATMPRDADCTRPHSTRKQSVDCRHKVLSPKPTD